MENYDHTIKLIIVGEQGVGKSSIFNRYCDKTYSDIYNSTIGVDYNIKIVDSNNKSVKLQIWDTAGHDRFKTITASYYRGAHIVILVFDLTNEYTFTKLKYWLNEIEKYVDHNNYILVGNKCDEKSKVQVFQQEIEKFALNHNMKYIETSAKKNINIGQIFNEAINCIVEDNLQEQPLSTQLLDSSEDLNTASNCSFGCCPFLPIFF